MKNDFNEAYMKMFAKNNNVIKEEVKPLTVSQREERVEKCKMFLSKAEVEEYFKKYLERIGEESTDVIGYSFDTFNILKKVDPLLFDEIIERFAYDNELEETEDEDPERAYSKEYEVVNVDEESTKYIIQVLVWGGRQTPAEYIFDILDKETEELIAVNDRNYSSDDEAYKDALDVAQAMEEKDVE